MMQYPLTIIIYIVLCFSFASSVFAQTVVLSGQVTDTNAVPISAVHLYCLNDSLQQATSTNIKGAFKLVVSPPFPKTLLCSHVSYRSDTLVVQQAGILPPIVLQKNRHAVTPIEITANTRQAGDLNYRDRAHIRPDMLNRGAGGLQDPARLTQLLPGVSVQKDLSNAFVVRGNTPVGNLWLIDGIETVSPNHFADFSQSSGAISIINTDLLESYDFYRSAFPAEFNNASSSVINLGIREGNKAHLAATINVGLLGLGSTIEGPINNKGATFLANYRYSTLSLLEKINHPGLESANFGEISTTKYQDGLYKLAFPTKKGKLTILGILGQSRLVNNHLATRGYAYLDAYLMGMSSLKYIHYHNHQFQSQWMVSVDGNIIDRNTEKEVGEGAVFNVRHQKVKQLSLNVYGKLNHRINDNNNLLYGLRWRVTHQDMIAQHRYYYYRQQTESWQNNEYVTHHGKRSQTMLYSFAEWHRQVKQHWFLNIGTGVAYYPNIQATLIEPRFSMTYHQDKWSWNYKVGLHNKIMPLTYYLNMVADTLVNSHLQAVRTIQQATTITYTFSQQFGLKWTPYFQYFFDVPVKNDSSSLASYANHVRDLPDGDYVNEGESVSYGMEVLFYKKLSNNWHFSNALSLFNSKFAPLDGKYRHTASNNNFIWSLNVGKNFVLGKRKRNLLQIDGQFFWAGGQRYQGLQMDTTSYGAITHHLADDYNKKSKAYMRLNLKLTYLHQKRTHFSWKLYVEVLNVLNRANEFITSYNRRIDDYNVYKQQGITPNIGFSCQFHGKK